MLRSIALVAALAASLPAAAAGQSVRLDAGDLELLQQAYLKASNTAALDHFGSAVAISGDTLVVGAHDEDSAAVGVDGDQGSNGASRAGAAYVFVREGSAWSQQAYLKASNTDANDEFGWAVAISGDTIVVGARGEDSNATGVDGDQADDSLASSGAAYVFVREGNTWIQQAYLKASNTDGIDLFGHSVAVDGDTVVVGATGESSAASGVDGDQADDGASSAGAAYVFVRQGGAWSQQAYLKASNTDAFDDFGSAVALSGDTLAVGAWREDSGALLVGGDQAHDGTFQSGAVYVFVRQGGTWAQQAYVKAPNTGSLDYLGSAVALDGDTLLVGAFGEASLATGVDGFLWHDGAPDAGAAYVYQRAGTTWAYAAYLKSSHTQAEGYFGIAVGLSGDIAVVGASGEAEATGAAYVFQRVAGEWVALQDLGSAHADVFDQLGSSVAASGDTLVVGARGESSAATGVGGDETNDGAPSSGAAFVFSGGPWEQLGGGTAGIGGVPLLGLSGPLTPGSSLTLDLLDGPPATLAVLFLSFSSTPAAFLGGTLHAFPFADLLLLGTDGAGELHLATTFPGAPPGQGLWFQVGLVDGSVPVYGASLSHGVLGTVP